MNLKGIFAAIALVCLSISASFAQTSNAKTLVIKSADNGKTFTVKKSQTFNVLFEKECVGCRDIWHLTKSDATVVSSVKEDYSNPSCKDCVGGNHDHNFEFKALKKGKTNLEFTFMEDHFNVTIIVK